MLVAGLLAMGIGVAEAGQGTVSLAGGMDFPTGYAWTGVDLAWHADGATGWSPVGRLTPAWAPWEGRPALLAEAGAMFRLPHEARTIRLGLLARAMTLTAPFRIPLAVDLEGGDVLGVVPGGLASLEFEFGTERHFVFGVRAGVSGAASTYLCPDEAFGDCVTWFPGFVGGFVFRGEPVEHLYLETVLGPTLRLGLGYAF